MCFRITETLDILLARFLNTQDSPEIQNWYLAHTIIKWGHVRLAYRTHKGVLQVVQSWKAEVVRSTELESLELNGPVSQLQLLRAWKPTEEFLVQAQVQSWRNRDCSPEIAVHANGHSKNEAPIKWVLHQPDTACNPCMPETGKGRFWISDSTGLCKETMLKGRRIRGKKEEKERIRRTKQKKKESMIPPAHSHLSMNTYLLPSAGIDHATVATRLLMS